MNSKEQCQCDHAQELEKAFLVISQLQETNASIQSNIEAVLVEGDRKISLLEQEKHDMELRISRQAMMAQSYQDDLEALQRELSLDKKNAVREMESKMSEMVTKHKLELSNMEGDLERAKVIEAEMLEQNSRLEDMMEKMKAQLKAKELENISSESFTNGSSEEMEALKRENLTILEENCLLQSRLERMEEQMGTWKNRVSAKDSELSKLACESVTYFNENERLKEKIKDLQVELEMVMMQSNKRQAKGNSLFAEVEDRRVEAEKQLIDIRIENDSLRKQLKITRDSLNQAKMQLSVKWDIRSAMEYKSRLETVRAENTKLIEENRLLNYKIKAIKEEEQSMKSVALQRERSDVPEVRRYQILFESSEKKLRDLTNVLEKKTTILHLIENRLRDSESALLSAKQELYNVNSEKDKFKRKLDDLISKYEPDNQEPRKQKKVEYHTEKLNFASRKKFQQTVTVAEVDASSVPTEASLVDPPPAPTGVSKSSRWSTDPSLESGLSGVNASRKSISSHSKDTTEPPKVSVSSNQEKNRESLSRLDGKNEKNGVLEEHCKSHGDLNRKASEPERKVTQVQSHKRPSDVPSLVTSLNKENSSALEVSSEKERHRRESEKKAKESDNVLSLHDELAMFAYNPGMMNKYNSISQDDADDEGGECGNENHILKDSSNICTEQPDDANKLINDSIGTKVIPSNPISDCIMSVEPNPTSDMTYDKKKNVDACKTQ